MIMQILPEQVDGLRRIAVAFGGQTFLLPGETL